MTPFAIAAAQVASYCAEIELNIETHAAAALVAAEQQVSVLIFPELSLTGYEPQLAEALAFHVNDPRLNALSSIAARHGMTIVTGAPVQNGTPRPWLASIVFHPDGQRTCYSKMHLGSEEPIFFEPALVRRRSNPAESKADSPSAPIPHRSLIRPGTDSMAARCMRPVSF